ncbi:MAG: hypothetical protein HY040_16920 [Planctomycetes bacterium]|nr:hypothetical protein [Planctomycetota bacterium]
MRYLLIVCVAGFAAIGVRSSTSQTSDKPARPSPVVPIVAKDVQPLITEHLAEAEKATLEALKKGETMPALGKFKLREKAFTDPWGALGEVENWALSLLEPGRPEHPLPDVIHDLGRWHHDNAERIQFVDRLRFYKSFDDVVMIRILPMLEAAKKSRDSAFKHLTAEERRFLFDHAPKFVKNFGPQLEVNKETEPILQGDLRFCELLSKTKWKSLFNASNDLCQLAHPAFLKMIKKGFLDKLAPIAEQVPGVTGDILYKKETPHGLILVGGKGPNTYDLKVPVALLIDIGGDDVYKGVIASSFDDEHPNSVVIDMGGNDLYQPSDFGLATGRLGVGILVDMDGNDTYKLAPGCGGVGIGGIGALVDCKGDDTYTGTRFTQGAAVMGIGLLWDKEGNDTYTSHGLAIGFGGPGGVGLVLDSAGNDSYQCGKQYPSGYNASDAPNAKPGDPGFQWDCFGLGMGLGRRVWPPKDEHLKYNLAGGIGMVIDQAGNDRYEASNFGMACGYFFGIGVILDLDGNDHYTAARYGLSAGAHYGMGLFVDYHGKDTYTSNGPTYNCGASWDRSVFLFIDAGNDDDEYLLERSGGLGRADHGSWGVFCDMGGNDRYVAPSSFGEAFDRSLAVFFDRGGNDDYEKAYPSAKQRPANGKTHKSGDGGLFVDR